ncbi:MAG: O-antigen ligase family protein [Nitrospiraceae bacterium]
MNNRITSLQVATFRGLVANWTGPHRWRDRLRFSSPPALLLVIVLLVFSPLLEGGTTHLAVMIIRLLILLLAGLLLATGLRAGTLTCPSLGLGPVILAYLGLAALSTLLSPYTHQSLQWLIVLFSYAGLLYLLVSFISEWDHIGVLLAVLVGMGLGEAGLAVIQAGWFSAPRPSGSFFNPNFLAGYLAAAWSVLLGSLCYRWRGVGWARGTRGVLVPGLAMSALALLLTAIVLTGSRGGLLALAIGTALVVGVRFGRKALAVLFLVVLAGLLLPTPLRDRFMAEHAENPLSYARWQIWQRSASEMIEHPIGIGLGLYQYAYPRYAIPVEGQIARFAKVAHTAHNEYLQMGVELGMASLVVFGWGVFMVAREAVAVLGQRLRRWQRGVVVGVSGATAGILTHAAVDSNLHEPAVAIVLTLCVAVILSMRRLAERAPRPASMIPIRSRRLWAGVGALVIGLMTLGVARLGLAWQAFEAGSQAALRQAYTRAIAEYQTALSLDPGKALYHSSIAAVHFHVFRRSGEGASAEAAIAELQAAIALNPLDGRLQGLLGHVYVAVSAAIRPAETPAGAVQEQRTLWVRRAKTAFERAVVLEPFAASHHYELGRVWLALGEDDMAERSVRHAVELEPNFLPGREWLARRALDADRLEAAEREYQEIVARQKRYADWARDSVEERFLKVDAAGLRAALERARAGR